MENFTTAAAPDCFSCRFRPACFFSKLEPAARKVWNAMRKAADFPDGRAIYSEGQKPEGIYMVCKGRVKVFTTDAGGQQMIIWIRRPGELFGHVAFFAGSDYLCGSQTMGSTVLAFLDTKTINKFLVSFPKTYSLMLHDVANELRSSHTKLTATAYKSAGSKVAEALINSVSFSSRNTPAPAIHGLKRTEIAEITGLALETVVRALAGLEKKKIIKREAKAIKILDHAALTKLAGNQL